MLYAISLEGKKIAAYPNAKAFCPECLESVIAKCGEINIWHWAHEIKGDCDIWGEHETPWHLRWKSLFPMENVEVLIEKDGAKHRADIFTNTGIVIELQHSSISPDEIREREIFYGKMFWLFDVTEPVEKELLDFRRKPNCISFRWKHPRKHIAFTNKPTFLDFGSKVLFQLQKMYIESPPCGGYGSYMNTANFIKTYGGNAT
jgi:hypothetical protein